MSRWRSRKIKLFFLERKSETFNRMVVSLAKLVGGLLDCSGRAIRRRVLETLGIPRPANLPK